MTYGVVGMQFVRFLPNVRYGTKFKLYIFIMLLENQTVIPSFANRVQPSLHKLSGDVTAVVLVLPVGRTYIMSPVRMNFPSCFDGRIGVWDYLYGCENTREEQFKGSEK